MAEEDNSQDKTEEPSQRKLDKAAEDGQVLSSKEMFVFTSLIMGLMVLSSIPFFARDFLAIWKTFFLFDLDSRILANGLYKDNCELLKITQQRDQLLKFLQ